MRFTYLFILLINIELIVFKYFNNNYFILILISPLIIGFLIEKTNWKKWLIIIFVSCIIFLWCWFFPKNWTIENLNQLLETKTDFYYLKNQLINYVNSSIKSENVAGLANYLLFNSINNKFQNFITTINNMGISHLFVVSGLHINLVFQIWDKLTKKWCPFWLNCIVRLLISCWFCYCLNFSNSTIRLIFQSFLKCNRKIDRNLNLGFACFLHTLIFNNQPLEYGFLFTYGCTFISILINQTKIKIRILKNYLVNVFCYFFTLPLIIQISHQINFCSILFNILLSPFIVIIFSLTLLLILIPYAYLIFYFPIYGFILLVNFFEKFNISIQIYSISCFIIVGYYFFIIIVLISIFLLKKNSKNTFFTYNEYIEINKKVKK